MKRTVILSSAVLCAMSLGSIAVADVNNAMQLTLKPYIGVQGGYAWLNYGKSYLSHQDSSFLSTGSVQDSGYAGRLYIGLNFIPYLGAEVGGVLFSKVKFNNVIVETENGSGRIDEFSFNQYGFDALLKAQYPFENNLTVFAKGGAGYIRRTDSKATAGNEVARGGNDNKYIPVAGGGVSYAFGEGKHIGVDLSYLRYFGKGDLEPMDLGTLGVSYTF